MTTPLQATAEAEFYDGAEWRNIPHGSAAALYGDGDFEVPADAPQQLALKRHRYITVTGNGSTCSIIDGRPDNNLSPATVRGFVRERRGNGWDAIIYTPRSWAAEYLSILRDFGHGTLGQYGKLLWWISTLDGKPWTAAGLAAELKDNWDADIPADRIWACQNVGGVTAKVDASRLFGTF